MRFWHPGRSSAPARRKPLPACNIQTFPRNLLPSFCRSLDVVLFMGFLQSGRAKRKSLMVLGRARNRLKPAPAKQNGGLWRSQGGGGIAQNQPWLSQLRTSVDELGAAWQKYQYFIGRSAIRVILAPWLQQHVCMQKTFACLQYPNIFLIFSQKASRPKPVFPVVFVTFSIFDDCA